MKRKSTALQTKDRSIIETATEKLMPLPKLVVQDKLLTPHPLPTAQSTKIRLRKQNNFMSQWVEFA